MTAVAILGYGEAGSIFARDLHAAGVAPLAAYDVLFDPAHPACAPPAKAAGNPQNAVADADLVISAVTAGSALAAAESVGSAIRPGAIYLDINSVSPGTKRAAFEIVDKAGARYVEAAVMASVPPHGIRVPMLLGGPYARDAAVTLATLGFNAKHHSDAIGVASAVKMCRSVVIKGLEALLTESLVSARHYGVEADVLASLNATFPNEDWETLAAYMIGRAMQHGRRRAEEMREVALTLEEAGLSPALSRATAERQDWAYALGCGRNVEELDAILDVLAPAIDGAAQ